jgi:ribosomal-protein-alanine N-acetyltransferase
VFVLIGERVLLRDFTEADIGPFVALSEDEGIFTYTRNRVTAASARRELASQLVIEPTLTPRPTYHLVIESSDGFAGYCGISGMQGSDQAEFGWYLSSDQWGRGYATETTRLLLRFGFGSLGRCRMCATSDPDNLASVRVLEKSGLTPDGPIRLVETWRGPRPRQLFSMSDTDWSLLSGGAR